MVHRGGGKGEKRPSVSKMGNICERGLTDEGIVYYSMRGRCVRRPEGGISLTPEKQNQGMRSMARDMTERRKWSRQTPYTTMINARVPNWLADKLRAYVEYTGDTITDFVVVALDEALKKYSPMERAERRDEGED